MPEAEYIHLLCLSIPEGIECARIIRLTCPGFDHHLRNTVFVHIIEQIAVLNRDIIPVSRILLCDCTVQNCPISFLPAFRRILCPRSRLKHTENEQQAQKKRCFFHDCLSCSDILFFKKKCCFFHGCLSCSDILFFNLMKKRIL